jgi:hypothetical protein
MRLIPRHKRSWLLVLLVVAIVDAAAIWWAASEKSEFERRFELVKIGMRLGETIASMEPDILARISPLNENVSGYRYAVSDDGGEHAAFDFEGGRLTRKTFTLPTGIERLLRWWTRVFGSKPPF